MNSFQPSSPNTSISHPRGATTGFMAVCAGPIVSIRDGGSVAA